MVFTQFILFLRHYFPTLPNSVRFTWDIIGNSLIYFLKLSTLWPNFWYWISKMPSKVVSKTSFYLKGFYFFVFVKLNEIWFYQDYWIKLKWQNVLYIFIIFTISCSFQIWFEPMNSHFKGKSNIPNMNLNLSQSGGRTLVKSRLS